MKRLIKPILIGCVLLLITLTAFGGGLVLGGAGLLTGPGIVRAADEPAQFDTFWQVWNLVQQHFIDRATLDPTQLTYGAIRGLVEALGDEGHTVFLTPAEATRQQSDIEGKFSGIGAQLGLKDGLPIIVAPFDGSPADQAGLQAGDILIDVDGQDVTALPLNEIVSRIRGPAGSQVMLTVFRSAQNKSLDLSITRGEIDVPAATWTMVPGSHIALLRLSQFSADATADLSQAISQAQAAGATGLIVDLRNDPGGLLDQAVKVTSLFLKSGNVLLQEDAQGQRQAFPVEPGGQTTDLPLVALVNRGTASAAEIFAGAIQDQQRGQVVGETTFGTGTVLEPYRLDDGSVLMLGTSQWLTPKGRLIRKHGIEPDVTVKLPLGTDLISPAELKAMSPADLAASPDTQLLKALELLQPATN
ncbi:MAG: S41 family peptidase [Anaerolineae bacterium]|nr:S41 family peptidase [Anaerolineae bacterium]